MITSRRNFLFGLGSVILLPEPKTFIGWTPGIKYRGLTSWEAGYFYCPYIPLQIVTTTISNVPTRKLADGWKMVNQEELRSIHTFKTRYGTIT